MASRKGGKPGRKNKKPREKVVRHLVPTLKIPIEDQEFFTLTDVPRRIWGTPAGWVVAFIHTLVVPQGMMLGQPLRLRKFQIDFIEDVYNPRSKDGTRRARRTAVFSVGRRNGKTLLASCLLLVHLIGPAARHNSTIISAANTREQASHVFNMCAQMVRVSKRLSAKITVVPSTKRLIVKDTGSVYRAISADASTNLGAGIDFAIYDEFAQAKNNDLYQALATSLGSQPEPLMMVISTQAPADLHPLSILIDDGLRIQRGEIKDDSFTLHLYTAKKDCDLMDVKEWYKANPALDDYRDLDELRSTMERASRLPSLESSVRVLYLNQRVRMENGLLSPSVWAEGNRPVDLELFQDPNRNVVAGIDLSGRTDLTACVFAVEDDDENVHLLTYAWTPADTLEDRAARDRAPYDVWERQGLILTSPGKAIDYDFVAYKLAEIVKDMNFQRLGFDPWRIDIMRQALDRVGFDIPMVEFGQGYKSMSPAIETFEELALMGKLVHGNNPVLTYCMSNAVVEMDPAGNRKLNKAKSYGRIDAAIAAVMAVGVLKNQEEFLDVNAMLA